MKTIRIRGKFTIEGDVKWAKGIKQPLERAEIELLQFEDIYGSPARLVRFSSYPQTKVETEIKTLEKEIEDLRGKSTHGNCCTCQDCKNFHDDCKCEEIKAKKNKIAVLTERKTNG